MNRNDFQNLSRIRLAEAKALFKLGKYDGAYYLAGYAVEFALKSCIAKETQRHDFPPDRRRTEEIYKHSAADLLKAAKLQSLLKASTDRDLELEANWTVVGNWSEQSRYQRFSRADVEGMIEAVSNRNHGVLPWLKWHW
jgi:HEPN domain-containing protein